MIKNISPILNTKIQFGGKKNKRNAYLQSYTKDSVNLSLNKKKIIKGLTFVMGAIALTAAITSFARKGKMFDFAYEAKNRIFSKKINDVSFDKRKGCLINGKKFSGTIVDTIDTTDCKDKIILKYKNGLIQESKRKGSKNFTKKYIYEGSELKSIVIKNAAGKKEFIKTKDGYKIFENGVLKKAFVDKGKDKDKIVSLFNENSKPSKSIKYTIDTIDDDKLGQKRIKRVLSEKEYLYDTDGRLSKLNCRVPDKFNDTLYTTEYSPNKSNITYRNRNILIGNEVVKEIKTSKDEKLPFEADICVSKPKNPIDAEEKTYYKKGKKIVYESIGPRYLSKGEYRTRFIQNDTKTFRCVITDFYDENDKIKSTVQKRLYDNGAYDILKKGSEWDYESNCIEHYASDGTLKGISERIYAPPKKSALWRLRADNHSYNVIYEYVDNYYDSAGDLINSKNGKEILKAYRYDGI